MKKESLFVVAIIGGLILGGLGFYLGMDWAQKGMEGAKTESQLADLVASKVIGKLTTTASGEITEISGRNLTLSSEGDSLTVSMKEGASIYRLVMPEETTIPQPATREEIELGEIKIGDRASISCVLKEDGTLEGLDVTLSP